MNAVLRRICLFEGRLHRLSIIRIIFSHQCVPSEIYSAVRVTRLSIPNSPKPLEDGHGAWIFIALCESLYCIERTLVRLGMIYS